MLKELNEAIRQYYSLDPLVANRDFDGFRQLEQIVIDKIDGFRNGNLPTHYFSLLEKMSASFGQDNINNEFYLSFPNLSLAIELDQGTDYNISHKSYLRVKISLLTNYYTLFFDEWNWFNSFSETEDINIPTLFRIIASKNNNLIRCEEIITKVKSIISEQFPSYKFAPHQLLFSAKVSTDIPIGYEDIIPDYYPFYAFLFDLWTEPGKLVILP